MLNDRDDDNKYEGHEESEYHFSEDEVHYEVETESPKPATQASNEPKESLMAKLTRSKRILISGAVFVVLVFIVYKMVSPTSSIPSTEITPPSLAQQSAISVNGKKTNPSAPAAMTSNAPMSATNAPIAATPSVPAIPQAAATTPSAPAVTTTTPTVPATTGSAPNANTLPPGAPTAVTNAPAASATPVASQPSANESGPSLFTGMPANAMPANTQPAAAPTTAASTTTTTTTTGMPAIIPVQSNVEATGTPATQAQAQQQPASDAALANLQATNEKLMSQLQSQYEQKLSDYQVQNKALQTEVDSLTNKVSTMQSQLSELVKALTRAQAAATPSDTGGGSGEYRTSYGNYTVQAIIPGRAWLKSEAGDTVTVAEGDVIRGLGRVTKIDPYDGVVEISTGTKTISLSYGNGS